MSHTILYLENVKHSHQTLLGRGGGVLKKMSPLPCMVLLQGLTNKLKKQKINTNSNAIVSNNKKYTRNNS
jgi:hypothetical protein